MRDLDYRIEAIEVWPGERTPQWQRTRSPFKTIWTKVLTHLDREIRMLRGDNVVLRLQVTDRDIRRDGMLRSDARPRDPGVVIQFRAQKLKGSPVLFYRCDRFLYWQDNVSAIARGLEALRLVDRYGVTPTGEQYAGFKALPSGGATSPTMSATSAAELLARYTTDGNAPAILVNPSLAKDALRSAIFRTHPDRNNGDRQAFDNVDAARKVLSGHFGISL